MGLRASRVGVFDRLHALSHGLAQAPSASPTAALASAAAPAAPSSAAARSPACASALSKRPGSISYRCHNDSFRFACFLFSEFAPLLAPASSIRWACLAAGVSLFQALRHKTRDAIQRAFHVLNLARNCVRIMAPHLRGRVGRARAHGHPHDGRGGVRIPRGSGPNVPPGKRQPRLRSGHRAARSPP